MKRKGRIMIGILSLWLCIFTGCEKKNREELLLVPVSEEEAEVLKEVQISEAGDLAGENPEERKSVDVGLPDTEPEENAERQEDVSMLMVHICGAVNKPGVYSLEAGSRLYQAIEAAGGFLEEAGEEYLNLAEQLSDGEKIYVPTIEEAEEESLSKKELESTPTKEVNDGKININTATSEKLCTLPGIGEGKAESIITYREKNGRFKCLEDIMNVEGIKEGLFQKIKDKITV